MFISVPLHPPGKDFSIESLVRCVKGGFVREKAKISPDF